MRSKAIRKASDKRKRSLNKSKGDGCQYYPPMDLESFLQIRNQEATFQEFVIRFLKPTYSKRWNGKLRTEVRLRGIADLVSITDEAFVLLVLENNWERWIDLNNQSNNNYIAAKRGSEKPLASEVLPKYTYLQGSRPGKSKNDVPVWKGWKEEGIKRFNELCSLVKNDRDNHKDRDKTVLQAINPKDSSGRAKKRARTTVKTCTVKPFVESDTDSMSESDGGDSVNSEDDSVQAGEL